MEVGIKCRPSFWVTGDCRMIMSCRNMFSSTKYALARSCLVDGLKSGNTFSILKFGGFLHMGVAPNHPNLTNFDMKTNGLGNPPLWEISVLDWDIQFFWLGLFNYQAERLLCEACVRRRRTARARRANWGPGFPVHKLPPSLSGQWVIVEHSLLLFWLVNLQFLDDNFHLPYDIAI